MSYGVSVVRIWEKTSCVTMTPYCVMCHDILWDPVGHIENNIQKSIGKLWRKHVQHVCTVAYWWPSTIMCGTDLARNGNSGCANEVLGCAKCHFWWKSPWKWKNLGNFRVCNWLPCLCKTQVHGWLAKTMMCGGICRYCEEQVPISWKYQTVERISIEYHIVDILLAALSQRLSHG